MSPRKKQSRKKPKEEHTHIVVLVNEWDVRAEASINSTAHDSRYGLHCDEDDPLYEFQTHLQIAGTSTWPKERAGDTYDLMIYGDDSRSGWVNRPLKSAHEHDEDGVPQYRTYRGGHYPVYRAPAGLALLDKVRGEPRWTAWISAKPRFVSDLLVILGQARPVYLAVHELKAERRRWIQSVSIQTRDPADEEE